MKVGIVGTRSFDDYNLLKTILYRNINIPDIEYIISGGAKGADTLAEQFATENNIKTIIFKPDWNKYGKSAGFKRNIDIIKESDIIFAFWNGKSKGTKHDITIAKEINKKLIIIYYEENNKIEKINFDINKNNQYI